MQGGLLRDPIDDDRYPISNRVRTLRAILDQLDPPPIREAPPPPLRVYATAAAKPGQRRERRYGPLPSIVWLIDRPCAALIALTIWSLTLLKVETGRSLHRRELYE